MISQSSLDLKNFQPAFDQLLEDCIHKLKGPMPQMPTVMAHGFFVINVQMSRNAWRTIAYLTANSRNSEPDWMWDYILIVPPISRTVLDSLFSVIFMLEDLPRRSEWFHKSGWRESKEQLEREKAAYANLSQWDEYLTGLEKAVLFGMSTVGVTPMEAADLSKITYWPNPGRMIRHKVQPVTQARDFLQYLNDWYYREASSQAHLSFHGIMKLGQMAIRRDYGKAIQEEIETDRFESFRAEQVCRTLTMCLALVAEVNHSFSLGLDVPILERWKDLAELVPEAGEIWDRRYKAFWP